MEGQRLHDHEMREAARAIVCATDEMNSFNYIIEESQVRLGLACASVRGRIAEIGCALNVDGRRCGIGRAAVFRLMRNVLERRSDVILLVAKTAANNIRAINMLRRLGFKNDLPDLGAPAVCMQFSRRP